MDWSLYKKIPNSLRQTRKAKGLTQKEVASFLGIRDNTLISRWEHGDALPSLVSVFRLSLLYKAPIPVMFSQLLITLEKEFQDKV